jgi:hypothetical protein
MVSLIFTEGMPPGHVISTVNERLEIIADQDLGDLHGVESGPFA